MQTFFFLAIQLFVAVTSFSPGKVTTRLHSVRMAADDFNPKNSPGSSLPFTFFDPLGLAPTDENEFKKYRESELKHGRIAMLATAGVLAGESGFNLFGDAIDGPAIFQYQQAENLFNAWSFNVVGLILAIEGYNIVNGWQAPGEYEGPIAGLKEDYVNGDIGFDPLGLKPSNAAEFKSIQTKELNNGRLAMIGIAGIIAQELLTGEKLF